MNALKWSERDSVIRAWVLDLPLPWTSSAASQESASSSGRRGEVGEKVLRSLPAFTLLYATSSDDCASPQGGEPISRRLNQNAPHSLLSHWRWVTLGSELASISASIISSFWLWILSKTLFWELLFVQYDGWEWKQRESKGRLCDPGQVISHSQSLLFHLSNEGVGEESPK